MTPANPNDPCVFCEIVAGRSPATIVYRTASTIIIEPIGPVTEGHLLVIPDVHVRDARESELITGRTFEVAAMYLADAPFDFNLITSAGASATQTVEHLHVHIVPRRTGDGLTLPWTTVPASSSVAAHEADMAQERADHEESQRDVMRLPTESGL